MKRITSLTIVLFVLVALTAGAAKKTTTGKRLIASFTSHPVTGMAFLPAQGKVKKAKAPDALDELAALLPLFTASAQTATVPSLQPQSFEGVCSTLPAFDATGLLQGAGRWDDSLCGSNWTDRNPEGAPVYKDGTLTQLVAFVGGSGVDAGDGVVDVGVWHAGAFTVSSFTCTLGTLTRCDMTGAVPVFDGDMLNIRAHTKAGNSYRNLRVVLTKE